MSDCIGDYKLLLFLISPYRVASSYWADSPFILIQWGHLKELAWDNQSK